MTAYRELIQKHCRPLVPRKTGLRARLPRYSQLRAVMFDIYGTLLISACGEIGTETDGDTEAALAAAFTAMGLPADRAGESAGELLQTISRHHEDSRRQGIDHPEVDIVAVWQDVLERLDLLPAPGHGALTFDIKRLAIEYEMRVNPTWPMPNVSQALRSLRQEGLTLGLISNAQFFTIELFPALLGQSIQDLGFDPELQFYSYQHGQAKPALVLYQLAAQAFESRNIRPDEVLYIGNDMLNDMLPAHQLGFRTGLFAGDDRSLRQRQGDARVSQLEPDVVLTDWSQLLGVVSTDQES